MMFKDRKKEKKMTKRAVYFLQDEASPGRQPEWSYRRLTLEQQRDTHSRQLADLQSKGKQLYSQKEGQCRFKEFITFHFIIECSDHVCTQLDRLSNR